jgi:glycosyltransferase involved in cell wall biosynthesis
MLSVGYYPYAETAHSVEAAWLAEHLPVAVRVAAGAPSLNGGSPDHHRAIREPGSRDRLTSVVKAFLRVPAVVAEGPGGFLLAALLRTDGFGGTITVLPYVNPRRWYDVAAVTLYGLFADPRDRVFLGSAPSAAIYQSLGVDALVGEPYGIDERVFTPGPGPGRVREELSIPPGRLLLYAGRAQPDKDLYRVLRVGLKARLLFPDLQVVVASHVVDETYLAAARALIDDRDGVHFRAPSTQRQLADLYRAADLFVTASTSHFETFGRAVAEALACGTPAVAPRYDGFVEVLAQPGGRLVDVDIDEPSGVPRADEEQLLRAVYEVLSAPDRLDGAVVAAVARSRFGRCGTIGLLRHLVGEPAAWPVGGPVAAAKLELPDEWRQAVAEMNGRDRHQAVSWFWDAGDHDRLARHDGGFAAQVRRLLCQPSPAGTGR